MVGEPSQAGPPKQPRRPSRLVPHLGTTPISILGLAFEEQIETSARSLYLIGAVLIVFGLVMLAADRLGSQSRGEGDITLRDAVVVGFAQALALVPGVSRAGATITGGLLLGLDRASAARFSFLLSVPAVVLSGLFQLEAMVRGEETQAGLGATAVATVLAFLSGYAAIAFLLRSLERQDSASSSSTGCCWGSWHSPWPWRRRHARGAVARAERRSRRGARYRALT